MSNMDWSRCNRGLVCPHVPEGHPSPSPSPVQVWVEFLGQGSYLSLFHLSFSFACDDGVSSFGPYLRCLSLRLHVHAFAGPHGPPSLVAVSHDYVDRELSSEG